MAWSTREIAELSGTTLKTVRYHHEIGLLDEPDRRSNGYKQYEVRHLTRLLQIKHLPADADEATREALAERLAPLMDPTNSTNPVTLEPKAATPQQSDTARNTAGQALEALYHNAQLDVLRRAYEISSRPA